MNKPINHKFHIVLSIITFGGWLPIYAIYYFFNKFLGLKLNARKLIRQIGTYFQSIVKGLSNKQRIILGIIVLIIGVVGSYADENLVTSSEVSTPAPASKPTPSPKPTPTPTLDNKTAAGTEVNISEIENNSSNDELGWYWNVQFKANATFLTRMDCVVKALNANGKIIGQTAYEGVTRNDGSVVGYGKDVKSFVYAPKATVLAIKSFDVKCNIAPNPVGEATFSISISGFQVINPASGYAIFTIRNVGQVAGEPVCRIVVEDESGTFKGTGWVIGTGVIEPGARYEGKKLLTIKKQGAAYVSQSSGTCD